MKLRVKPDPNLTISYLESEEGKGLLVAWIKANLKYDEQTKSATESITRMKANLTLEFLNETGFCFEVFSQTIKHLFDSS